MFPPLFDFRNPLFNIYDFFSFMIWVHCLSTSLRMKQLDIRLIEKQTACCDAV
ncbi:hypothetical protein ACNSPU_08060 [Bacillus velezensis]